MKKAGSYRKSIGKLPVFFISIVHMNMYSYDVIPSQAGLVMIGAITSPRSGRASGSLRLHRLLRAPGGIVLCFS